MNDPDPDEQAEPTDQLARKNVADSGELTPAIVEADEENPVSVLQTDSDDQDTASSRRIERDLTPDEMELDQPDEFDFSYIPTEQLPTGVQYTPEFDPDWVYPSGSSDGGRQDDAPVQGLEIGVVATAERIEETVRTVLNAISLYYNDTGQYPRHRIIKSATTFEEIATDSIGLVAVIQPAPDEYSGLMDHMKAVQSGADGAINSNIETSQRLVKYLGAHLVDSGLETIRTNIDVAAAIGWETATQIGTLPLIERYAPLGASELYDPRIEDLDLSQDGVESITDAEFTPRQLSIETTEDLFDTSELSE